MRTPHEAGAGCLCIIAKAARLDPLDATGKVDSCDKQNDVASYPGAHSRVPFLGASIMSATSFSVQLQNEMEGKINYFHYQNFGDPASGTKSALTSPQTTYDFNLYPGGKFIATTAESYQTQLEDPKLLRFKFTNNSGFPVGLLRVYGEPPYPDWVIAALEDIPGDESEEDVQSQRELIIDRYNQMVGGVNTGPKRFPGGVLRCWIDYEPRRGDPSKWYAWLLRPGRSTSVAVIEGSVWAVSEAKNED
nr:hypothetical protein [uncultured Pseudomonas sp.]